MENIFNSIIQNIVFWVVFYSVISFGYRVSKSKKEGLFKTKKFKGYYTASSDELTAIAFVVSFIALAIAIMFIICNCNGVTDVDGNNLIPHVLIFLFLFIWNFCIFLYGKRRRIYFNKKELIVYPLLKRRVFISYDEINKVIVAKNRGIVLFTNKGRYTFDEFYSNKKKFIKILEEKKFQLIYANYFYKKYDN